MRASAPSEPAREEAVPDRALVREKLHEVAAALRARDVPVPEPEGKLLRPLIAYALVPPARRADLDDRFWLGALAVQMAHEASLLHDDILDDAVERRGSPTLSAERGVAPALVLGDHYLTGAYRAALATGSEEFLRRFIVAVERTVAGEVRQARGAGERIDLATYFDVVLGKSGELLGAAAGLGAAVLGLGDADARASLGRQLGALYQQVDDLLDYCVSADTGKEPLKDYRQRKWTWLLEIAEIEDFDRSDDEVMEALFARGTKGISAAERSVRALEIRRDGLLRALRALGCDEELVGEIVSEWIELARTSVARQVRAWNDPRTDGVGPIRRGRCASADTEDLVAGAARRIGGPDAWPGYFARHARTFSLAARLFPPDARAKVAALYAFCRFTDDLVDEADGRVEPAEIAARLEAWAGLAGASYGGQRTDIPLLDRAMTDAREAGVDWLYPQSLLAGAAMDVEPSAFESWKELERYTFCVAGAVGGWMTQLFGVHDRWVLERAHALGHAMQLTNILRDVGEDMARRRLYLPWSLLRAHGLRVVDLSEALRPKATLPDGWPAAMEELIARADEHYLRAAEGLPALPSFFSWPVAAAAESYRGIHREVRRNGYDNLRKRAHTSTATKLRLGLIGLVRLARTGRANPRRGPAGGAEIEPYARLAL